MVQIIMEKHQFANYLSTKQVPAVIKKFKQALVIKKYEDCKNAIKTKLEKILLPGPW